MTGRVGLGNARFGKMRPGVGDVLGEFGDEVQGVEDLKVTGHPRTDPRTDPRTHAAEEGTAGGLWEASAGFLLGEVDHRALLGEADHALETQRAPEHVVRKPLASGVVVGAQPDGMVHAET